MSESDEERTIRIDREAEAAWGRLKSNEQWADWRYLATGFSEGRRYAMKRAGTNRPEGKNYSREFSEWMGARVWTREVDKPPRAALLWYADNSAAVEAWLATLALNQRQKWNHPHTLRKHFEAAQRPPQGALASEVHLQAGARLDGQEAEISACGLVAQEIGQHDAFLAQLGYGLHGFLRSEFSSR